MSRILNPMVAAVSLAAMCLFPLTGHAQATAAPAAPASPAAAAAKPAPAATAAPAAAATPGSDRHAEAGALEVIRQRNMEGLLLGRMGEMKATSEEVKRYATLMMRAHSESSRRILQHASRNEASVDSPRPAVDPELKGVIAALRKVKGTKFDKKFVELAHKVNTKTLDRARDVLAQFKNPGVQMNTALMVRDFDALATLAAEILSAKTGAKAAEATGASPTKAPATTTAPAAGTPAASTPGPAAGNPSTAATPAAAPAKTAPAATDSGR